MEDRQRPGVILQNKLARERFDEFAANLRSANVYVTIDLDCLRADDALTNWERTADLLSPILNGRSLNFGGTHQSSAATFAARIQSQPTRVGNRSSRRIGIHPKIEPPNGEELRKTNFAALERLWPALAH